MRRLKQNYIGMFERRCLKAVQASEKLNTVVCAHHNIGDDLMAQMRLMDGFLVKLHDQIEQLDHFVSHISEDETVARKKGMLM